MSEKLFRVKVKAPLIDGATAQDRLIRGEKMDAVVDYLLEIKKADPDDVAALMEAGVKVESARNGDEAK